MAKNWTIRRGMERRSDIVQDAAERLQEFIMRLSLVKKDEVDFIMTGVRNLSVAKLHGIEQSKNSFRQIQALLDVIKNKRIRKEYAIKLAAKDDVTTKKQEQKKKRLEEMDRRMNLHIQPWQAAAANADNAQQYLMDFE